MSKVLKKRLAELEARAGSTPEVKRVIILVSFVEPNGSCEADRAEAKGQVWHREPNETLEQFEDRVIAEMRKGGSFPKVVIFWPRKSDRLAE
jgi:hypothetical protein